MVHVHRADRALAGIVSGHPRDLSAIRGQGAAALLEAQALAREARSVAGRVRAGRALASVERQLGRDAGRLGGARAHEPPSAQSAVAVTIAAVTFGQQVAGSVIAKLIPLLPAAARGALNAILVGLAGQDATQATQLAGTLDTGSIACLASGAVQQALTLATQAIGVALAQAQSALALAPASVRSQLQTLLDGLPAQLAGIEKLVEGLIPCSSTAEAPARPAQARARPAPARPAEARARAPRAGRSPPSLPAR